MPFLIEFFFLLFRISLREPFTSLSENRDIKYIYFVNSDPKTIGTKSLEIPRFGIDPNFSPKRAVLRTYDINYFMTSKQNSKQ